MSTATKAKAAKPARGKVKSTKDNADESSFRDLGEVELFPDQVIVRHNDRTEFDQNSIAALAASIEERGLDNAITVRVFQVDPVTGDREYELIAGERRLRACQLIGQNLIRARVVKADDQTADLLRLEENILREDLSPIDKAAGIKRYIECHGESQATVGKRFGMTQAQVSNLLRLLQLTPVWQDAVKDGRVPHTVVRDVLCPWAHRPQLLEYAYENIGLVEDSEVNRDDLELVVHEGLRKLTRSCRKTEVNHLAQIGPDTCCFKLDDKNRHTLDIEDLPNGEPRAWNVDAWQQINEPAVTETKQRIKKKKDVDSKPKKSKEEEEKPVDLFKLKRALGKQLGAMLADGINAKKHKTSIVRVFAYLAIECDFAPVMYGTEAFAADPVKHVSTIAGIADAEFPAMLCRAVQEVLRDETRFEHPAALMVLGSMLPLDLSHNWTPNAEVLECYPDSQLVAFAHDHEVNHDQKREALIEALLKPGVWNAGHLPAEVSEVLGV